MRWLFRLLLLAIVVGPVVGGVVYRRELLGYFITRPEYREAEVLEGELVVVVNATGRIEPVRQIHVGANVSGPVVRVLVDFNDVVEKDQLLAQIDPRLQESALTRDTASLAHAQAEVQRSRARLERSQADYARAQALHEENAEFISATELDRYRTETKVIEAEILIAEASVTQAEAALENSETNLKYTDIIAPEAGVVLDRTIEEGQTVAASFQVPDLFVIAPRLEEEVYIHASVVEADIGMIHQAQVGQLPVTFTVDAYPEELFEGGIRQVRMTPIRVENVVTYPVVISAPNPDMRLLPGMTADLSFEVQRRSDVVKIPNAALRFYPNLEQVRPEDRGILEGRENGVPVDTASTDRRSAPERIEARSDMERRHVWVREGELLRAIEVWTGLNDYRFTELVRGELVAGMKLVTGLQ